MFTDVAVSALLPLLLARTVTLDEAERTAEANNPQIHLASSAVAAGVARVEQARAPALPQVKLDLLYERTTGNRVQKPGQNRIQDNTFDTSNWYAGALAANQLLWDFGQTLDRWRAAEARAAGLGDSERAVRLQVQLGARAAFFRARAQKALVEVARETLANEDRHLAQVQGFVQAGSRPEIDLAQARATRATRRVQLIEAENAYVLARASLNEAMGVTGGTDYDVGDQMLPPIAGEDGPVDPLIDQALLARPEVAALRAQMRGQQLTVRALHGAYFPTLSLVGGATDAGVHLTQTFENGVPHGMTWNFFAGLNLQWQIFQGLLTRGQVREAEAGVTAIYAQQNALVQQIWVGVQQAAAAVRAAKEALVASEEALVNARERLRLAEGRYSAGAGSIIELNDAQVGATNAAAVRVGAEYQLAAARAELALALGQQ
jgi:outer membrane protein